MSLDRKVSGMRKAFDYVFPFADKYDSYKEAEKLMKYDEIKDLNLDISVIEDYIVGSYNNYKGMMTAAKFSDTADRVTSIGGIVFEGFALMLGGVGGFVANGGEELAEMAAKTPFLLSLYRNGLSHKIPGLLAREAGTAVVPILGDVYDIATNKYISVAYEIIREDAKYNILRRLNKDLSSSII